MPFPAATGPYPPLAFLSLVSRHNERDICILDGADLAPVSPGSDRSRLALLPSQWFPLENVGPFLRRFLLARKNGTICYDDFGRLGFLPARFREVRDDITGYISMNKTNFRCPTNLLTLISHIISILFINSKKEMSGKKKNKKMLRNTVTTENSHGYQYLKPGRVKKLSIMWEYLRSRDFKLVCGASIRSHHKFE